MKAIILAGGNGTRLSSFTKYTSKQLLPVYNQPMVYYPYETLRSLGIKNIALICKSDFLSGFMSIFSKTIDRFFIQNEPTGIPDAFKIVSEKGWLKKEEGCALILGDNLFDSLSFEITDELYKSEKERKAFITGLKVSNPSLYGVIHKESGLVIEKPQNNIGELAVPGFYYYPEDLLEKVKILQPSSRGETEISELSNLYIQEGRMNMKEIHSQWFDCGSYESLLDASNYVRAIIHRNGSWQG